MEAIGYLATLSSHRVSSDAPLLRFGTERALIRARLVRGEQSTVLELEINAGAGQPCPDQPQQSGPCPGHPRHLPDRALRPGGPGPGQGRSVQPPAFPGRAAGQPHSAPRRDPQRLRPGAEAAQRAAQIRPGRKIHRAATRPRWMSGTSTWRGPGPNCCTPGLNWWNGCGRTSKAPTPSSPTGPRKPAPSTVPRCREHVEDDGAASAGCRRRPATATRPAGGSAPALRRRTHRTLHPGLRRRHAARNWNAGFPSSGRTATSLNSSWDGPGEGVCLAR